MANNPIYSLIQPIRKLVALLLVSVYLLFSVGVIKATHFCMGREASVAWFSSEAKKCPCSAYATEKDSCCDDQNELLRLENEQKVISTLSLDGPGWIALEELFSERLIAANTGRQAGIVPTHKPAVPKVPRWKTYCSLVLYGDEHIG